MRKVLPILLVLAMVLPSLANVTVSMSDASGDAQVDLAIDGGSVVRGVALKVTVTGANATGVTMGTLPGDLKWAFIDYYYTNGVGTELPGAGAHPVAAVDTAGVASLPATEFVISAGILDDGGAQAGLDSSIVLCTIDLDGAGEVCVVADALRGGIVGDELGTVVDEACVTLVDDKCYKGPDQAAWVAMGEPESWCADYQCYGDANNAMERIGRYDVPVGYADITILLEGFGKVYNGDPIAQPWIAADFTHSLERIGRYDVPCGYADINLLLAGFGKNTLVGDCNQ